MAYNKLNLQNKTTLDETHLAHMENGIFTNSVHTHSEYTTKDHKHDNLYEPIFIKNPAFNKNFGITTGTVAEGNHKHDELYANKTHNHETYISQDYLIDNYYNKITINEKLIDKVDVVSGKGLSTNDFDNIYKTKVDSLFNYDDNDVRNLIIELTKRIEALENAGVIPVYRLTDKNGIILFDKEGNNLIVI